MLANLNKLIAQLELLEEQKELGALGLSIEEIEGYLAFFVDNYPELKDESIQEILW